MKNLLKIGFVAGFTFFSTLAFAKDNDNLVSLETVTSTTIKVGLDNAKNVSLYVYNEDEDEIYSEEINEGGYIKDFNFKNLASGTYYLVAETNFKVEKYKIIVNDGEVSLDKTPVEQLDKPKYNVEKNVVNLRMDSLKGKVKISVYDLSDNVYYNEVQAPENGKLNINFDLNPDASDVYVIRVEKNGEVYKQTFYVK